MVKYLLKLPSKLCDWPITLDKEDLTRCMLWHSIMVLLHPAYEQHIKCIFTKRYRRAIFIWTTSIMSYRKPKEKQYIYMNVKWKLQFQAVWLNLNSRSAAAFRMCAGSPKGQQFLGYIAGSEFLGAISLRHWPWIVSHNRWSYNLLILKFQVSVYFKDLKN